jgi:hypothetical protein
MDEMNDEKVIKRLEHLIYWYICHVGEAEGVDFLHNKDGIIDIPEAKEIIEICNRIDREYKR